MSRTRDVPEFTAILAAFFIVAVQQQD